MEDRLPVSREQEKGCAICGRPGKLWSGKLEKVFCERNECYEMAQRGSDPQEAKIIRTKEKSTPLVFVQGDLRFQVFSDLFKTLGSGMFKGQASVIDKLMDSQIISLAQANGIPVSPYVRELVRQPLHGLIQLVWYRDLKKECDMERLKSNQIDRIADYMRSLAEYKPSENGSSKRVSRKSANLTQSFRVTKTQPAKGRARQLWEVIAAFGNGGATGAQIREKAEGAVKTKQDMDRIVARFIGELLEAKAIEQV